MKYKITLPRCYSVSKAKECADILSKWSGSPASTIISAIMQKDVVIRKEATAIEAMEIKKIFNRFGVQIEEVDSASTPPQSRSKYSRVRREDVINALKGGDFNKVQRMYNQGSEASYGSYKRYVNPNPYDTHTESQSGSYYAPNGIPSEGHTYIPRPYAPLESETIGFFDFIGDAFDNIGRFMVKHSRIMISIFGLLISVCSFIPIGKHEEKVNVISSTSELNALIGEKMEFAYFEGQKDALNKDIRIQKKSNGHWKWSKSPWDDREPYSRLTNNETYRSEYGEKNP